MIPIIFCDQRHYLLKSSWSAICRKTKSSRASRPFKFESLAVDDNVFLGRLFKQSSIYLHTHKPPSQKYLIFL